jgi:glucoamylase
MNSASQPDEAFGAPGIAPTWSSSDKDFVTTALGSSRLWAAIGHGIVNEVYWPSTGQPQIRDLGFYLVGQGRWIDLKRESRSAGANHRAPRR